MHKKSRRGMRYDDAGVSIDRGNAFANRVAAIAKSTYDSNVLSGVGGFGAFYNLDIASYRQPVLVSATDGVGTKIKLALEAKELHNIGIDLVAMSVNDIITSGAKPLFFLDYLACAALDVEQASSIIEGIAAGCRQADCALVGGETAEMPGLYQTGDYDIAGFAVGVAERSDLIDRKNVAVGNKLIALASSGAHANGYSLIRSLLEGKDWLRWTNFSPGESFTDILLKPTRIYVATIQALAKEVTIKAIAHITGGGIIDNLPRVLPTGCTATIQEKSWQWPKLFLWLQETGAIQTSEMLRTFNCGVGMVLCVANEETEKTLAILKTLGETAWVIGEIAAQSPNGAAAVKVI